MSGYTIGEIAVWLVLTALVGIALGWVLSTLFHRRYARTAPTDVVAREVVADDLAPGPYPRSALALDDGGSPGPDWTIKAKTGSAVFHGPTSPHFPRTRAEVWFRTEADAIAAGFRKPKGV